MIFTTFFSPFFHFKSQSDVHLRHFLKHLQRLSNVHLQAQLQKAFTTSAEPIEAD